MGALARLRSDLASSVTHELRTPLTQIRLAAETVLLGRSPTPEAERRSLASIVDETKRLQQLIDNVLHFSRAERQATRVRVEPVELRPVVERAAGDLAPLVAGRGIVLRVDISGEVVVQGNANACARSSSTWWTTARGTGLTGRRLPSAPRRSDGQVELWVEDRGPGVPVADRQRVWDAFVRLDRDRDSVVTGTGLGLTVVRELVEAQGGGCWIEGAAGQGARVVVRLAKRSGAAMIKVLVVEDHLAIAQGLRENLELEGFEVRVSGDGIDAIQVATSWMPDLVLLDLMLPRRSGFDVLAAIRARAADMPVMVLSARGGEAEKVRALRAGADDYVVKPFGLMEVLARVHALLRRVSGDRRRRRPGGALPTGQRHRRRADPLGPPRRRAGGVAAQGVRPPGRALPGSGSGGLAGSAVEPGLGVRTERGDADGGYPHRGPAPAAGS